MHVGAHNVGISGDRALAAAAHGGEESALGGHTTQRGGMIQAGADAGGAGVLGADFEAHGALANAGEHDLEVQNAGENPGRDALAGNLAIGPDGKFQTTQAGGGEDGPIKFGLIGQLLHTGADVAANFDDIQIGTSVEQLRFAAGAARGDGGADRQILELQSGGEAAARGGADRAIEEDVADIGPLADGTQFQTVWQFGGQVLQAVDGEVRLAIEQGDFEFLGEQAFGEVFAFLAEGGGLQFITGGLDDFQRKGQFREGGPAFSKDTVGLGEREGAAAGGDVEGFGSGIIHARKRVGWWLRAGGAEVRRSKGRGRGRE